MTESESAKKKRSPIKKNEDLDTFFRRMLVGTVKAVAALNAREEELMDWQKSRLGMLQMQESGFRKIVRRLSNNRKP